VKKLLAKVSSKDKFNYRKLTDNVIQDTSGASVVDSTINQQSQLINERPFAQGLPDNYTPLYSFTAFVKFKQFGSYNEIVYKHNFICHLLVNMKVSHAV